MTNTSGNTHKLTNSWVSGRLHPELHALRMFGTVGWMKYSSPLLAPVSYNRSLHLYGDSVQMRPFVVS